LTHTVDILKMNGSMLAYSHLSLTLCRLQWTHAPTKTFILPVCESRVTWDMVTADYKLCYLLRVSVAKSRSHCV